ncbi:MAG: sugar ABC transporter substrate-binding protein, partial [Aeromonas sp.]
DRCAINAYQDFLQAQQQDNLLPSMAEGMAMPTNMRQAIFDVLGNFFHDTTGDPLQTAQQLERAIRSAR